MAAGTLAIGFVTAMTIVQLVTVRPWISAFIVLGLIVVILLVIPISAWFERSLLGGNIDATLCVYLAAEMAVTLIFWRLSTGGWFNYALEAVAIASVLAGRALSRAFERPISSRSLIPAALAVLSAGVFAWTDVKQVLARRGVESGAVVRLLESMRQPAEEIFFVDQPGLNRLYGRRDLVYDPWLYPVFESIGLAEPRSTWLEPSLATGRVRTVATTSGRADIDGLKRTLPDLGYTLTRRVGPYFVLRRQASGMDQASPP